MPTGCLRKPRRAGSLARGAVARVRSIHPHGLEKSQNFYQRVWLPALRRLGIRERPYYNTRHSYVSFMISIGKKVAFVSEQTGHSIRTLEARYKKYFPTDDDLEIPPILSTHSVYPEAKVRIPGIVGGPENAKAPDLTGAFGKAGDRGRTGDLMLGKHTL